MPPPMIYGNLPIGTGRDWARGQGVPFNDLKAAARWIAAAEPRPTDIGKLTHERGHEYFLNIASAGISGEIAERVNRASNRRPWSFMTDDDPDAVVVDTPQHDADHAGRRRLVRGTRLRRRHRQRHDLRSWHENRAECRSSATVCSTWCWSRGYRG